MSYEIVYSDRAYNDLQDIYRYISTQLLSPDTAKSATEKIMDEIDKLCTLPNRNPLLDKGTWKSRGLRKFFVGNFIVFYLTIEEKSQVLVVTVMYAKRDISKILDNIT